MFTPHKAWPGWSRNSLKKGTGSVSGPDSNGFNLREDGTARKGKSVTPGEPVTPVPGRLIENGIRYEDPEVLAEKVVELEKELYEYQYNMGLLLIEKKEWTSQYEELKQALDEANELLKREHASHLIAISDVEKREESLRKALGVEKQCVLDLEKMLHDIRSENAELKFTAESKLAEVKALETSVDEKSLQVEAKLRASDAKLAEMSRKSSEIERKLQELESREAALQRERLSLMAEQEEHEAAFSKQREDLREWERRLQESEERLAKSQMLVRQREDRANEIDRMVKQKEKELEEVQKKIDAANLVLKKKEDDVHARLQSLSLREQESDALRKTLEQKEEELRAYGEKLNTREQEGIQKLVDEHNAVLAAKKHEFDLEMEEKKKSFDDSMKSKLLEVEKKEAEVRHMEEKVAKRERAVDNKWEKLKGREKDMDLKVKNLNEKEKALKSEEKALQTEKQKLLADKEDLQRLKIEVENIKAENEAWLSKIHEEEDHLKVTEEERSEYHRLQAELKEQIEKCRLQEEQLIKESEDLKGQKEHFEKEWEELDEKRAALEKELKDVNDQKERLERHVSSEEEKLRKERKATDEYIQREMAALEVAKESFAATMEHERSMMSEKAESERSQMLHDFEMHKRKLETEMWASQEEKEKDFQAREKLFEEEKEKELGNINYLREVARREMEEMKLGRAKIEKERQEIDASKRHLEEQQIGIRKDIDDLVVLTKKLKDQRDLFINEKERFISFVENHKSCGHCSEITSEFLRSDSRLLEIEAEEMPDVPQRANNVVNAPPGNLMPPERQNSGMSPGPVGSGSPASGKTMSWLRRCTSKFFKLSPIKKMENPENLTEEAHAMGEQACGEPSWRRFDSNQNEADHAAAKNSSDVERVQSDVGYNPSAGNDAKVLETAEDSQHSDLNHSRQSLRRGRARISRTRSVRAVVEDAKAILGKATEIDESENPDATVEDSGNVHTENRGEPSVTDKGASKRGRKRNRGQSSKITLSGHDGDESEGRSESVTEGGQRRKRRQRVVPAMQGPVETRYNLRRPRKGVAVTKLSSEREVEEIGEAGDAPFIAKAAVTSSVDVMSDNGGSAHLIPCENAAYSQNKEAEATKRLGENDVVSEEVSGTPQRRGVSHDAKEFNSYGKEAARSEEREEDDEEPEHPGEVSIGKKLWTFFTT